MAGVNDAAIAASVTGMADKAAAGVEGGGGGTAAAAAAEGDDAAEKAEGERLLLPHDVSHYRDRVQRAITTQQQSC